MSKIMTFEKIKQQIRDEWLLIAYTELDENLNVVQGKLLLHSPEVEDIYNQKDLVQVTQFGIQLLTPRAFLQLVGELPHD